MHTPHAATSNTPLTREALEPFWMPMTPNRQFKSSPRLFTGAEGMHYTTQDGRRILDGMAGLWCVNAGHGQKRIVEAIQTQAAKLDFVSSFQMSHPAAFELAGRITEITPEGLDHVFFTNSGSESVDTALKIARGYHRARGEASRIRFISRMKAYHGMGWGGLSVSGLSRHRRDFGPLLPEVDHLSHTHDPEHAAFSRGQPAWGAHFADELEKLLLIHDPSTVAAVIVEPVTGSGGVFPPPVGYLERLRKICDQHGILLIFDEVITGFGRLGAPFAANALGVTPDLITCAKGMTNAAVPMGGVITSGKVYQALMNGPENTVELFHGYTYSAHPLACAAGLAALDVYQDLGLFDRARQIASVWETAAHALRDAPYVTDIRNIGLLAAIDLKPRDGAPGARGPECANRCYDDGILIRAAGDTLMISPPLIITEDQIVTIFAAIRRALDAIE
ncbi:omega amino acid--pyruvate aminotransferase [Bradyrhizobium sp. LTSPM299]|uniref:aspartate aminotransferase family protein n=1 Tax=Bradyrhizobium sp. LTSPM299 TaxID=1619233 RepID=UPI0005CB6561|nr:aspartate aminotransferase family protein [Bradyrhizobium sp. LTSPM299]KJC59042.1 omega amino acid--pyruvate aminotransferase [Bradyrhizobium sp. LTSPM299]